MLKVKIPLENHITIISRKQAMEMLGCGDTTLRKDVQAIQEFCNEIAIPEWDYIRNSRGFSKNSLTVIWVLRQLTIKLGRTQALLRFVDTLNEMRELT